MFFLYCSGGFLNLPPPPPATPFRFPPIHVDLPQRRASYPITNAGVGKVLTQGGVAGSYESHFMRFITGDLRRRIGVNIQHRCRQHLHMIVTPCVIAVGPFGSVAEQLLRPQATARTDSNGHFLHRFTMSRRRMPHAHPAKA